MSKSRGDIAKDRADHVMEQLSGLDGVRRIPMMGGYIFYIHDRVFGGIYESCDLMIKITEPSRKYMPNSVPEPPLEGQGHASLHDPGGQGTSSPLRSYSISNDLEELHKIFENKGFENSIKLYDDALELIRSDHICLSEHESETV